MWTRTKKVPKRYSRLISNPEEGIWLPHGKHHIVDGGRRFPSRPGVLESPPTRRFIVSDDSELIAEGDITVTVMDRARVTSLHGTVFAGDDAHMVLLDGAEGHALGRSTFEARANSCVHVEHGASGDVYDEAEVHLYEGLTGEVRLWNITAIQVLVPWGWRRVYEPTTAGAFTVRMVRNYEVLDEPAPSIR